MIRNDSPLLLTGTLFLVLAVIPALGVLYEVSRVPWNQGPLKGLGRVLFSKAAVLAALLVFSLIGASLVILGLGRPTWFEVLRLVTFALIVPILFAQWYVYRRIRLTGEIPETLFEHEH